MPKPVADNSPIELFTLGYEGFVPDTYFDAIQAAGVTTLVDVRRLPQSRKPGFSKRRLNELAVSRGVSYVHMALLGTPREILYDYRTNHDHPDFKRRYMEYLETQPKAVQELADLVKQEVCCLMCVEANPAECHRTIVAERLRDKLGRCTILHLAV